MPTVHQDPTNARIPDVIAQAIAQALANVHTATIAKVTNVTGKTISCKPVVNRVVDGLDVELPEFLQVPVFNFGGGSSSLRMPIVAGDYALLVVMERCIDQWWTGKDFVRPAQFRVHDYSDAIALCGLLPDGSAESIPSEIVLKNTVRLGAENPTDKAVAAQALLNLLNTACNSAIAAGGGTPGSGAAAFTAFKTGIASLVTAAGDPKVKIK